MVKEKETTKQLRPLLIKLSFYMALKTRQQMPSHKVTFLFFCFLTLISMTNTFICSESSQKD